jgi:hypothetical protein
MPDPRPSQAPFIIPDHLAHADPIVEGSIDQIAAKVDYADGGYVTYSAQENPMPDAPMFHDV